MTRYDANATAGASIPLPERADSHELAEIGGVRWALGLTSNGRLWGGTDEREPFTTRAIDIGDRSATAAKLIVRNGQPWLVSLLSASGTALLSWSRLAADGERSDTVTAERHGRPQSATVIGDTLVVHWPSAIGVTPYRATAEVVAFDINTGAVRAARVFDDISYDSLSSAAAGDRLWMAARTGDDHQGGVKLLLTNGDLETLSEVVVSPTPAAYSSVGTATAVAAIPGGALVAWADSGDSPRPVRLARVSCP